MNTSHRKHDLNPFSYWIVPGKFLAGDYPGIHYSYNPLTTFISCLHTIAGLHTTKYHYLSTSKQRQQFIINANIKHIVDLTKENERYPYFGKMVRFAAKHHVDIQHHRFPISDRSVPSTSLMKAILDFIDEKIQINSPVYLHCFRGLGRTGLVVGCYLARHGSPRNKVLTELDDLRSNTASRFRASPQNQKQRDMIEKWQHGT